MDGEADHAAEYERLRAELADFVLDALAARIAAGEEPQLSQALTDAIDRRVEQAVSARVGQAEWPDPDAFADQVIAAARGRAGESEGRSRAPGRREASSSAGARRSAPAAGGWSRSQIIILVVIAVAIIAAALYIFLNRSAAPVRTETMNNVSFYEPTPDGATNAQLPPGNAALPTSAGAATNAQGPAR